MPNEFLVFQSFTDISLANDIAEHLSNANIPVQLEDSSSPIDPLIIGTTSNADIRLKLQSGDFEKAHQVLDDYYSQQARDIAHDHYLFDFTNAELKEIIEKPDEWGKLDYHIAQKILAERGDHVLPEQVNALKQERIEALSQPEKITSLWIWFGYLLAVFFSLIGIFYGSFLAFTRKTLPNGQQIHSYTETDRKHGKIIFIISCILMIVRLMLQFATDSRMPFWKPF